MTTELDEDVVRLAKGANLATATTTGEPARRHLDESRRYVGTDVPDDRIGPHGRIILTIAADTVTTPARYFARARVSGT